MDRAWREVSLFAPEVVRLGLRRHARSRHHRWARILLPLTVAAVAAIVGGRGRIDPSTLSWRLVNAVTAGTVLCAVYAVLVCADAMQQEVRGRTIGLLVLTVGRPFPALSGIMLGRLVGVWLTFASLVPLIALCALLGGVAPADLPILLGTMMTLTLPTAASASCAARCRPLARVAFVCATLASLLLLGPDLEIAGRIAERRGPLLVTIAWTLLAAASTFLLLTASRHLATRLDPEPSPPPPPPRETWSGVQAAHGAPPEARILVEPGSEIVEIRWAFLGAGILAAWALVLRALPGTIREAFVPDSAWLLVAGAYGWAALYPALRLSRLVGDPAIATLSLTAIRPGSLMGRIETTAILISGAVLAGAGLVLSARSTTALVLSAPWLASAGASLLLLAVVAALSLAVGVAASTPGIATATAIGTWVIALASLFPIWTRTLPTGSTSIAILVLFVSLFGVARSYAYRRIMGIWRHPFDVLGYRLSLT
ncbi:MAG: hypothetical protein U0166_00220 [Acidobacteriota bacterium]